MLYTVHGTLVPCLAVNIADTGAVNIRGTLAVCITCSACNYGLLNKRVV